MTSTPFQELLWTAWTADRLLAAKLPARNRRGRPLNQAATAAPDAFTVSAGENAYLLIGNSVTGAPQ
jgi:hypothetical protein